jgi:hypothetical protein
MELPPFGFNKNQKASSLRKRPLYNQVIPGHNKPVSSHLSGYPAGIGTSPLKEFLVPSNQAVT